MNNLKQPHFVLFSKEFPKGFGDPPRHWREKVICSKITMHQLASTGFFTNEPFSFLEDKWSYSQIHTHWQFDVPLNGDRSWILGLIETCQRLFVKEKMEQSVTILWIYVSCSTLRPLSISCFLLVIHPPSQKGFTFGGPRDISLSHISKDLWSSDSLSGLPAAAANVPAAGAGVTGG